MSAAPERWAEVDRYIGDTLVRPDPVLVEAIAASDAAGIPPHQVSPAQGKLLELLVRISGARRILELGTLGGYSAIWLARALPAGGRLITLEIDPDYAAVARSNLARAGLDECAEVRVGAALELLPRLLADGADPFDLIFIDADKASNDDYLRRALELSRPGTLIVADNVVRGGAVVDPDSEDPHVQGVRRFAELIAAEPRLTATAIQTVGVKGYDGFAIALVTGASELSGAAVRSARR